MLLALHAAGASGATPEAACRPWREQRDALATAAMTAELQLVHQIRLELCPALERQAQRANALERDYGDNLDFQALLDCRHRAEERLRSGRPVLYRNRQGFIFYTPAGAALARQADALQQQARLGGCP